MNLFSILFDRVYINIGELYDENHEILDHLDLMPLIYAVAKANPAGDIEPLYDRCRDEVFERRTKFFIVRRVEEYIFGMQEILSIDENMATFASKTQLNHLIRSFGMGKKRISCYALIYLYIIYTLLEGKSPLASECAEYVIAIHKLIMCYFEDHPKDQLAEFAHGCFDPIIQAVKEGNTTLENGELPFRPRKHPKNINENSKPL